MQVKLPGWQAILDNTHLGHLMARSWRHWGYTYGHDIDQKHTLLLHVTGGSEQKKKVFFVHYPLTLRTNMKMPTSDMIGTHPSYPIQVGRSTRNARCALQRANPMRPGPQTPARRPRVPHARARHGHVAFSLTFDEATCPCRQVQACRQLPQTHWQLAFHLSFSTPRLFSDPPAATEWSTFWWAAGWSAVWAKASLPAPSGPSWRLADSVSHWSRSTLTWTSMLGLFRRMSTVRQWTVLQRE